MNNVFKQSSHGIILRSWLPDKRRVLVLDQVRGKIMSVPKQHGWIGNVMHGMLARYSIEKWRDIFFVSHVEPIALPVSWVSQDILFLHQILELCATYLPYGHEVDSTFDLVGILYNAHEEPKSPGLFKKIFLCKILFVLGMYPHEDDQDPAVCSLLSRSISSILNFCCDAYSEEQVTRWLSRSLGLFPADPCLKTFSFVKDPDVLNGTI